MSQLLSGLYREEALAYHSVQRTQGEVLRISPAWIGWTYWAVLGALLCGLLYAVLGRINQYESGPAVVRVEGRTDVTARAAGTVAVVEVQPGQRVAAGQLLLRFHETVEANELERINREFDLLLVRTLRDPTDQASRQALTALRAQRELAEARLQERFVRAPHAGTVRDLRIRPGQHLAPGDIILSLIGEEARFSVVAMLPGHARPLLQVGMPLRLELSGYRYHYRELRVDVIGDEIIGPTEVRRYLGQELADTVNVQGPVVLVRAHLPSGGFVADDRAYSYYDGMQGTAEARVRVESLLLTMVPGLKEVLRHVSR